jgi:DNA-binding NtrC family response regulator
MLSQQKTAILVIDDDDSILRAFKRIFERNGYLVCTAQTGKEAAKQLEVNSFDAALFDLKLQDMNGKDLLPLMAKTHPEMVTIALTGLPDYENVAEEAKRGTDVFFTKPVKPETLLNVLEAKLKTRKR